VADGAGTDTFPIEGGARPVDATREEAMLDEVATGVGALTLIVDFLAADRARRRRVRNRILSRAGAR
jgi:hypothetical protein